MDFQNRTFSLILPSLGDWPHLLTLISDFLNHWRGHEIPFSWQIIWVEDGLLGHNEENKILTQFLDLKKDYPTFHLTLEILRPSGQSSLGMAIARGLERATGIYSIIMDSDGNHRTLDVATLVKHILKSKTESEHFAPWYCGQRLGHLDPTFKWYRRLLSYFFNSTSQSLLGLPDLDISFGLIAAPTAELKEALHFSNQQQNKNWHRIFAGHGDYSLRLLSWAHARYRLEAWPCLHGPRYQGTGETKLIKRSWQYAKALSTSYIHQRESLYE